MEVIQGDIAQYAGAEVLVNIVTQQNKNLESQGAIAISFAKAGGNDWKQEVEKHLPLTKANPVISTGPGELKCKKVIHIKAEKWTEKAAKLEELFDKTFSKLRTLRLATIAIPVFGGGFLDIEPALFYECLSKAYYRALKQSPELKVKVVSFEEKTYKVLKQLKDKAKIFVRQLSKTEKPTKDATNPSRKPPALDQPLTQETPVTSDHHLDNVTLTRNRNLKPVPSASRVTNECHHTTGTQIDVPLTVEHRMQSDALIPKFWKNCSGEKTSDAYLNNDDLHRSIPLEEQNSDFRNVKKMFLDTFKNKTANVTKICRVENIKLYHKYESSRKEFCIEKKKTNFQTLTDKFKEDNDTLTSGTDFSEINKRLIHDINEKYLFHGTKKVDLDAIITQGFDSRVSKGGFFGSGTYFAEHPMKSDGYTDCNYGDDRVMVLSRVILGDIYKCRNMNKELCRPPCTRCDEEIEKCDHTRCDSVMGTNIDYREFVIYDHKGRTYPEYVIYYKVGTDTASGKIKDGYKKPAKR